MKLRTSTHTLDILPLNPERFFDTIAIASCIENLANCNRAHGSLVVLYHMDTGGGTEATFGLIFP